MTTAQDGMIKWLENNTEAHEDGIHLMHKVINDTIEGFKQLLNDDYRSRWDVLKELEKMKKEEE